MFPDITKWEYVIYDTESTGLHFWKDKMFSFAITAPDDTTFYYDIRRDRKALEWARKAVPKAAKLVCHNAKFDWHLSREQGIIFPEGRVFCTMITAAVLNEHEFEYNLAALAKKYTDKRKDDTIYAKLAALFGGAATASAQAPNFARAPCELMEAYASDDTIATNALYKYEIAEVEKQGLQPVVDLEMALLPCIVRMEWRGVHVDIDKAVEASQAISKQMPALQKKLDEIAGFPINPNPSGSIHQLFNPQKNAEDQWVLIDGTIAQKTDAGKASIDADCLRDMKHPAADLILRLRKMKRTKDVFLDGHVMNYQDKGVIHCNMNQTKSENDRGVGAGRLSINEPALQQIPARDLDIAEVVRSVFIAPPGYEWLSADWAQMDFRVFAHYVKNQSILDQYRANPMLDFHQVVSDLTGIPRKPRWAGDANSKQINLGLVFGMGQGKLAAEMGLPYTVEVQDKGTKKERSWLRPGEEAKEVFKRYHQAVPGVKDMLENASAVAKSRGFVRSIMGRHIRFPRGMFTHKAGGLIFQGSAADALKVKIIQLDTYFEAAKGEKGYLALNVHDEFDAMIPTGRTDVHAEIHKIVTDFHSPGQPIIFRIPIVAEIGVGPDWWSASK